MISNSSSSMIYYNNNNNNNNQKLILKLKLIKIKENINDDLYIAKKKRRLWRLWRTRNQKRNEFKTKLKNEKLKKT